MRRWLSSGAGPLDTGKAVSGCWPPSVVAERGYTSRALELPNGVIGLSIFTLEGAVIENTVGSSYRKTRQLIWECTPILACLVYDGPNLLALGGPSFLDTVI